MVHFKSTSLSGFFRGPVRPYASTDHLILFCSVNEWRNDLTVRSKKFWSNIQKRKNVRSYENVKDSSLLENFKILKYYFRFQKSWSHDWLCRNSEIGKMEWDNLDEIMPNEITKFDQNQISKWSHQLAASSYYYSGKSNGSLKRHAETLKAIIGKG